MRTLRLGLAQINTTVGDLDGNLAKILDAIGRARELGVELLAFPEMVVTGYPPEDLLLKPVFIERAQALTRDLVPHTRGMTVVVGTIERDVDLYNAAAILHDGHWIGTSRKRYLPNYGVFDENRYFSSERETQVYEREGVIFGVNVCEDIWVSGGAVEDQVVMGGAEIVLNLSASPYHRGKVQHRQRMISTRASDHLAIVGFANLVGGQDEIVFDGSSLIVDQAGTVVAAARMFEEDLLVADLDLDEVFNARLHDTRLRKERQMRDDEPELPRIVLPPLAEPPARPALPPRPAPAALEPVAEIYQALVTGTRDYVDKSGFDDVVIGLSGGIDSALTACIAVDALGPEHVTGVSMSSRWTSGASEQDAEALAKALGIRFGRVPIRGTYDAMIEALTPAFEGRSPDTTEENLQARIRGTYLMALSNKFNWMVLTTGNKSETSVGYSTLYGDTAGGFAVLKDVYKTQVYELARWRNAGGGPIPENTLTRAPSAELRPDQTDQDSLPPYDVLDPILRLYVEEDRSIREIVAMGYDGEVVRRIVKLVDQAEYKRRQSPPGVKITTRAFGKDRRLPLINGWRG